MAKTTASSDKPKTVKVEALEDHTYNNESYEVGDTYEIDEALVDSVTFQGKAVRVDRVQVARAQKADAEKATKARAAAEPKRKPKKAKKAK